jgi:hypothetical protein
MDELDQCREHENENRRKRLTSYLRMVLGLSAKNDAASKESKLRTTRSRLADELSGELLFRIVASDLSANLSAN